MSALTSGSNQLSHLTVTSPVAPEQLLQDYAMQTQHDVFVLLWIVTLGAIGFLLVYKVCDTLEKIWRVKENG